MRRRLLCANWKMNLPGEGIAAFVEKCEATDIEVAIAPPFPFIRETADAVARSNRAIIVGAQNCSEHIAGAYTGEVSVPMLRAAGATLVILGHSERRSLYGESSALVGRKLARVLAEGLRPILCVGENQEQRDRGETNAVVSSQLDDAFAQLDRLPDELVVAYEPVWAIGTGRNATPEMAAAAHNEIRAAVAQHSESTLLTILYGGSVTPDNAAALAAEEEIDGFLVGGASLDSGRFLAIGAALRAVVGERS